VRHVGRLVEQRGDELLEAGVVLAQPGQLAGQGLDEPSQLLEGRQVAVLDHSGRGDLEVHRPQQRLVELGLPRGQLVGRGRRQADDVDVVAQLLDQKAHHVPPQRRQVVALVEHHRAHTAGAQSIDAPARAGPEQVGQLEVGVLPAGNLALDRRDDAPDLAVAALGGAPRPAHGAALDLLHGLPLRAGPLGRPAPPGHAGQRVAGVVQAREGLVGEAEY